MAKLQITAKQTQNNTEEISRELAIFCHYLLDIVHKMVMDTLYPLYPCLLSDVLGLADLQGADSL